MERRLRLGLLGCVLLCGGCPRPSPPKPPAPSPGVTRSPSSPASPGPEATPARTQPLPTASPLPSPSPSPSPSGPLAPEVIPLGTQLHPWPGVTLGLERVEALARPREGARREELAGHLTLGLGQIFCSSDVFAGDRLRVGGALLEVLAVEPKALRFRWLKAPTGAEAPQVRPARPRLRELGLYRFSDGRVLGVGKVATLAKRDGTAVQVVNLSVFPPGYERNPLQDYEVLPRLVVGKALGESALGGRKLHLSELKPARPDSPGWIRLAE